MMKADTQRTNWVIDTVLFGGFLGSLWLDLTGVAAHQVLGLAVAALSGYHLWKHWPWVDVVTSRLFDRTGTARTSRRARTCYLVDTGLAVGLAVITGTGFVISTWLNLGLANYAAWHALHVVASVAALVLIVVKIGLHWRWVLGVGRRGVFVALPPARTSSLAKPAPAAAGSLGRRDFVRLMVGAGAVALVSGVNAFGALRVDAVEGSAESQNTASQASSSASSSVVSGTCTMRCNRRCSYPGHCRKYTDSNNNGRCDLGECTV